MASRLHSEVPPLCGEGAGGRGLCATPTEQFARNCADGEVPAHPVVDAGAPTPTAPPSTLPARGRVGWAPADRTRQKDRVRVADRARRMRAEPTPSERRLWGALRQLNREDGANFRRQCAVDGLVYDFGDYSARVLIELDGVVHELIDEVALRDATKTAHAHANDFRLLRFRNDDVWRQLDRVVREIRDASPSPLRGGSVAQRPGRGAVGMKRAIGEGPDLLPGVKLASLAPLPDTLGVDMPRKGAVRRLPRRKKS